MPGPHRERDRMATVSRSTAPRQFPLRPYRAGSKCPGCTEKETEWRRFHAPQVPGNSHCAPTVLVFVSSQIAQAIERKRSEEALRESELRLRAIVAALPDLILVLDREGALPRDPRHSGGEPDPAAGVPPRPHDPGVSARPRGDTLDGEDQRLSSHGGAADARVSARRACRPTGLRSAHGSLRAGRRDDRREGRTTRHDLVYSAASWSFHER